MPETVEDALDVLVALVHAAAGLGVPLDVADDLLAVRAVLQEHLKDDVRLAELLDFLEVLLRAAAFGLRLGVLAGAVAEDEALLEQYAASATFSLVAGISTNGRSMPLALRMRVSMSAIGSVIMGVVLLSRGYQDALRTPGINPSLASLRKQMRQTAELAVHGAARARRSGTRRTILTRVRPRQSFFGSCWSTGFFSSALCFSTASIWRRNIASFALVDIAGFSGAAFQLGSAVTAAGEQAVPQCWASPSRAGRRASSVFTYFSSRNGIPNHAEQFAGFVVVLGRWSRR